MPPSVPQELRGKSVERAVRVAWHHEMRSAIGEHRLMLSLIAGYVSVGLLMGVPGVLPRGLDDLWQSLFLQISAIAGLSLITLATISCRLRVRTPGGERINGLRGWTAGWAMARRGPLSTRRLSRFVCVLLAVAVLGRAFIGWKAAIPEIQPFVWDGRLSQLDRVLHGGVYPWQLLQSVLGFAPVTRLLDYCYLSWHAVLIGFVIWQAWSPRQQPRDRFLLTFVLAWIVLGTVAAIGLSSVGPCYYGLITDVPADPYAPLMTYLGKVSSVTPLAALQAQAWLWSNYLTRADSISISAMPSMHVALPVLYAVTAWQVNRHLGQAFAAFAILIFLGSIHLGWHYAVDGYAGAAGIIVLWWWSGYLLRARAPSSLRSGQTA
jgi:PAP2 superfamily